MLHFINNTSGVFHIYVYVNAGVIHENAEHLGISHMMEHMFFKKTKHMTTDEILKSSTRIGGVFNATTDKDCTIYYFKTNTNQYERAIKILGDMLMYPKFVSHDLEKERLVVFEELKKGLDNEDKLIWHLSNISIMDKTGRYARRVIGEESTLKDIKTKDLYDYYNANYGKYVILVNCERSVMKDAKELIHKIFKNKITPYEPSEEPPVNIEFEQKVIVVSKDFLNQNNIMITFPWGERPEYSVRNIILCEFISFILTGAGLYSYLLYELREKRNLLYNIHTFVENMKHVSMFKIWLTTSYDNVENLIHIIFTILRRMCNRGLRDGRLRFFKEAFKNSLVMNFSDADFASVLTGNILFNTDGAIVVSKDDVLSSLTSISNADIVDMCNKLFDFQKVGVVVIGNVKGDVNQYANDLLGSITNKFVN